MDGNVVTFEAKQTQRWKTYFEAILNKEEPRNQAEIPESKEDLKVNTDPPSAEEVRKAIRTMKSGKAPGADCVSAEMLKAGGEVTMGALTEIFEGIWETEETPGDWKMGLIIKLPKKGDLSLCKNWRGITLLSITSKVFSRVILDRISEALDPLLRKEQECFRKGKSCGDHIFTLRQILEQCQEWNTPFYANFVDIEKAFNSIHIDSLVYTPALWNPPKIVSIIKLLYSDFRTKVICGQYLTEDFEIKTGVKQGCILYPFHFCLGIDWVMKETALGDKSGLKWTFTETLDDLNSELARNAGKIGLQININKTKMLRNNSQTANPITIGGRDIEEVTEFTYLGAKVSTDGNSESEIKARIRKARGAFVALKNIWKTNKISNRTKIRLFKSNVLSVLLYAAESWKVTKGICQMLEVFQNKCLRKILQIYWPNQISNTELHERTGMQPISLEVKRRRWKWIGHVCRMPLTSIPRVAMRWTPGGKRARGDPRRHEGDQ